MIVQMSENELAIISLEHSQSDCIYKQKHTTMSDIFGLNICDVFAARIASRRHPFSSSFSSLINVGDAMFRQKYH